MSEPIYSPKIDVVLKQIALQDPILKAMFCSALEQIWTQSLRLLSDGRVQVTSTVSNQMSIRDTVRILQPLCLICRDDAALQQVVRGGLTSLFQMILSDAYANQFHLDSIQEGSDKLLGAVPRPVCREFALDALLAPVQLLGTYWMTTGDESVFNETTHAALSTIIDILRSEQKHSELSSYDLLQELEGTLLPGQKPEINPVGDTGMIWSAYRPDGTLCKYNYNIPVQMMVSVTLSLLIEIFRDVYSELDLADELAELQSDVNLGIERFGIVENPQTGLMYIYETDGLGNYLVSDSPVYPSLISAPFIGFLDSDSETYQNTRQYVLSQSNPDYRKGVSVEGIQETGQKTSKISMESLIQRALVSDNPLETQVLIQQFKKYRTSNHLLPQYIAPNGDVAPDSITSSVINALFLELVLTQLAGSY